jgi:hypothetical protein
MSFSFNKVGDVRLAAGDRAGALAAYEESLVIRRKLAAADPSNASPAAVPARRAAKARLRLRSRRREG